MAESAQPPKVAAKGEVIYGGLGRLCDRLESGQPIAAETIIRDEDGQLVKVPCTITAREPEEIIPDGYTLRVELIDNRNGAMGSASKQLTIVDLGDNPALVTLAGTLAETAHKSLKRVD